MDSTETAEKLQPLDRLSEILGRLRSDGKIVVQCHGVFDLLHPGHIRHFEAAKRHGDVLVVTISPDRFVAKGPGRPVFNERLRAESVAALGCVDYVAINEWPTAVETIKLLRPRFYAKGSDYRDPAADLTGGILEEEAAAREVGGEVAFTSEITFSSSGLLNQFYEVYPEQARRFLEEFRTRYTADDVIGRLQSLAGLRALVIGETIIDEYHYCQPVGKSPKESIVATQYVREEIFGGGVIACANHLAGFCRDVTLVTCLGETDSRESFIRQHLRPNITPHFFIRPGASTIVKRRYVWEPFLIKMFEVCFMEDDDIPAALEADMRGYLDGVLDQFGLVLVADYGHGLMVKGLIDTIVERSRFLAVNTQANSANLGFNLIKKYPKADYVCIDEPEIRLAFHDRRSEVQALADELKRQVRAKAVVVTRGHHGSLAVACDGSTHEVPVFSREVVDRVGAGDAYLSVSAPCMAAGLPIDMVAFVGNAVGALAVKIVGNRTAVEPVPLFKFITALLK